MFKAGDIVRHKQSIYCALIIRVDDEENNEPSTINVRRIITAKWLNWEDIDKRPFITLYEHTAQEWWEKVN
jgi:hypothetical protein